MLIPLYVLAVGAVAAGACSRAIGDGYDAFWKGSIFTAGQHILHDLHHVPPGWLWSPFVMMVLGFGLAYLMYIRDRRSRAARRQHPLLYRFLLNKWYFDELYDLIFVRPAKRLGRFLWKTGDGNVIDGIGPDGVSARVRRDARGSSGCRPAISITTPSPCSSASPRS
jgi:NADH-quinone oxidoreductase subunit L